MASRSSETQLSQVGLVTPDKRCVDAPGLWTTPQGQAYDPAGSRNARVATLVVMGSARGRLASTNLEMPR